MKQPKKERELKNIPIDEILPNLWNPNVQEPATFNELVENIREHGFLDPVQVVVAEGGGYMIVGGEHRWKAAKIAGLTEIPAVVIEGWDEDMQKVQTVKLNVIRGKLDPKKFTELWLELEQKYGPQALQRMMGFSGRETQLRALLRQVQASIPKELRDQVKTQMDEIRNVEDLALVVNSLYSRFGRTLKWHYLFLVYAGKMHAMVQMDKRAFETVKSLLERCEEEDIDANDVIVERLSAETVGGR